MASTIQDKLIPVDLGSEMKKSFISYAMAVIVSRALPDVRDGLKPVHRRILYAMNELGMTPDKPFRKCARVVGDVLGKYHPHGDSSVYDALVRLAQDFNMRYTLVEGQGNFGSVDGDGAAAMRYTECRLDKLTAHLIGEIDKDTVDFYPNFDETLMQPTVLPSRYPNLLVNGANGIAVGMATNIPTHNLGEVIDGCVHMIDHPDCSIDELMHYIKGPDFPTGAQIMGTSGIRAAYHTGRGRIIMRAKNTIEQMSDNRSRIVITEIPYGVNKANLITKIAELHKEKRLEGIHALRDESDRSGMRIVIELKKGVYPQVVLNYLYKHTSLQETFGANILALVNGEPKVLNLREILYYYLEHQKDVVQRRTRYDLDKAEARAHIVEGLLKALDHIDEIVSIIRHSGDTNIARNALCERFGFTEKQAQAILDMRLARLTGLESDKLQAEYDQLVHDISYYRSLLADEHLLMGVIRQEMLEIRDKYSDERRTEITPLEDEIDVEDLIQPDDMVVTMTNYGYVKRISHSNYRAQHRGGKGISGMTTRDEDYAEQMIVVNTHDDIMFFTNRGRVYSLKCYQIPEAGRTARGIAIVNLLQIAGDEKVTAIIPMPAERTDGYLVMMTRKGMIKRTPVAEFTNLRKTGLIAITLREDDELCSVNMTDGNMSLIVGSRMGRALRMTEKSIRVIGRSGMGVRVMKLAERDELIDMSRITENQQILSITTKGYGKRTPVEQYREQGRNGMGIKAITLSEKSGQLAAQLAVDIDEDIMLITDDGTVIRMHVADIRESGRTTQGVRLMRLRDGAQIVSVARIDAESEDEEIETVSPENAEDDSEVIPDDDVIAEADDSESEAPLNEESEL